MRKGAVAVLSVPAPLQYARAALKWRLHLVQSLQSYPGGAASPQQRWWHLRARQTGSSAIVTHVGRWSVVHR